jgi:hypothetical protein
VHREAVYRCGSCRTRYHHLVDEAEAGLTKMYVVARANSEQKRAARAEYAQMTAMIRQVVQNELTGNQE